MAEQETEVKSLNDLLGIPVKQSETPTDANKSPESENKDTPPQTKEGEVKTDTNQDPPEQTPPENKSDDKEEKSEKKPEPKPEGEPKAEDQNTDDDSKNKKPEKPEEGPSRDEIFNEELQKYNLQDKADLDNLVTDYQSLLEENERLKEAPKEPEFDDPRTKQIYDFLTKNNVTDIDDGLLNYAKLQKFDVKNLDDKTALRELYLMSNPEIPREKAMELFEMDFEDNYTYNVSSDDEDFDKNKKRRAELRLEAAALKAKKQLQKFQTEWKPVQAPEKDQENKPDPEAIERLNASKKKNVRNLDQAFKTFDTLTFSVDDNKENDFHFKFDPKQKEEIKKHMEIYLNDDFNYDDKGNLKFDYSPESQAKAFAYAMFGDQMMEFALKHANNVNVAKQVEIKSKQQPDRTAKAPGNQDEVSIEQQFINMAKEKEEARNKSNNRAYFEQ